MTSPNVPAPGHAALFGRHVRLRLAGAPPASRYEYGDRHGYLVDLNSPAYVGLRGHADPGDDGETHACRLADYTVTAYPRYRVHVFRWAAEDCWSWCREISGDLYDHSHSLPRFDSRAEATDAAWKWLADTEAALAAKALTTNGA